MVIDTLCDLPTYEGIYQLMAEVTFKKDLRGYLDVYGRSIAGFLGVSLEEFKTKLSQLDAKQFLQWMEPRIDAVAMSLEEFIGNLDAAGVERAVLYHFDEETTSEYKGLPNDFYADIIHHYSDRLMAYAAVDPHKGVDGVREFERAIKDLGLQGLALRPFMHKIRANDPRYYPLYAKCVELDVPVWIHTSINFTHTSPIDFGRPIYLDTVACVFPKLKIIAGHGGWPWVTEMVSLAWKHPNIYLDFATVRPSYMAKPGSGWEPLFNYGNRVIRKKILFASTWMLMGMSHQDLIEEIWAFPLEEETKEQWLSRNGREIFSIGQDA